MKNKFKIAAIAILIFCACLCLGISPWAYAQRKYSGTTAPQVEANALNIIVGEKETGKNMNLTIKNDLMESGVEIIGPENNDFGRELSVLVGNDKDLISLVESASPLSFIIKNNSAKEIVGVSFRWSFVKNDGETQTIPQIQTNPGVLMGIKPVDPGMVGRTSIINSNDIRFFSYFGALLEQEIVNANMRFKHATLQYPSNSNREERSRLSSYIETKKKLLLNRFSEISVSIDGILFNDGSFAGDDRNHFFPSMSGRLQARKDFLRKLKESKRSGELDSDFLDRFFLGTPETIAPPRDASAPMGFVNGQQAYDLSYQSSLISLRKEISRQRSKLTDTEIINQLKLARESNFIALYKIGGR